MKVMIMMIIVKPDEKLLKWKLTQCEGNGWIESHGISYDINF